MQENYDIFIKTAYLISFVMLAGLMVYCWFQRKITLNKLNKFQDKVNLDSPP